MPAATTINPPPSVAALRSAADGTLKLAPGSADCSASIDAATTVPWTAYRSGSVALPTSRAWPAMTAAAERGQHRARAKLGRHLNLKQLRHHLMQPGPVAGAATRRSAPADGRSPLR